MGIAKQQFQLSPFQHDSNSNILILMLKSNNLWSQNNSLNETGSPGLQIF